MPRRAHILLLYFVGLVSVSKAQTEEQLRIQFKLAPDSVTAALTLVKLSEQSYKRNRAYSEELARTSVIMARRTGNKTCIAKCVLLLTNVLFDNGKYEESYYIADELLDLSKAINDNYIYADACKIIGRRHHFRGEYDKALEFYLKSLNYFEKGNNLAPMSEVYNSMGGVFLNQSDTKKAYDYYHKAQAVSYKINNTNGVARGYLNMANALIIDKNYTKAQKFLDSAMFFYRKMNWTEGVAYVHSTYSDIFIANGNLDSALSRLHHAETVLVELNKLYTLSQVYLGLSHLYLSKKDMPKALIYVDKGIDVAKSTNQTHNLAPLLQHKSNLLEKMGRLQEALIIFKAFKACTDSVINAKAIKKQAEDALKYDYDKQEYQRQMERQKEEAEQKEKETRQKVILNFAFIGVGFLLFILFLVARSYRAKQKSNKIIAEQKAEVEKQHHLLQEKNKEVLDSIAYAKRLQQAILPSAESIKVHLPNSFVFYKPKDIVAGDFYWMETTQQTEKIILIAAADCTGHGVPGALVSVVCSNALNRSVLELGENDPAKILDRTRELVISTFEKSDKEVKDGMDISLCAIYPDKNMLQWAGANNPLWIISCEGIFTELKPDKQPIGKYASQTPFHTHVVKLQKGDRIYMFTDGYADQFGGPKGKKLKYKQLQQTLMHSTSASISEHKDILDKKFNEWKGNLEQVDDVCVIGIEM